MQREPLVEILIGEFKRRKSRNPAYSLRSFSRNLGIDASNLSKIMSYRKKPGARLKVKLAEKIGLETGDLDQLLSSPDVLKTRDSDYGAHGLELFQVIAGWQHYAILELFKLKGFKATASNIARRLNIATAEAKASLERLQRVGLLEKLDGQLVPKDESSSSVLGVTTSKAHRDQQREILEKAIEALETTPIDRRSQSSMTFAIDTTKIGEAKELIKKFRRDLGRLLSASDDLDEVYHLSVSLYPVTIQNHSKETL